MENWNRFDGSPPNVSLDTYLQLELSNGNKPIEKAHIFTFTPIGRGTVYPDIFAWRIATEEDYNEYQQRKAEHRLMLHNNNKSITK